VEHGQVRAEGREVHTSVLFSEFGQARGESLDRVLVRDTDGEVAETEQAASECPFEAARSRLALGQVY
jgi:hypothetical protein